MALRNVHAHEKRLKNKIDEQKNKEAESASYDCFLVVAGYFK